MKASTNTILLMLIIFGLESFYLTIQQRDKQHKVVEMIKEAKNICKKLKL
jgi:hypothetical protein